MSHSPKRRSAEPELQAPGESAQIKKGHFESAFHNSPALQSVVRASDGVIVEVNDTFLRKMGRTREQVIGKTPFELGSWVDPEKLHEYRREFESKGKVLGFETSLRTSDGKIVTMLLSSHPVEIDGVLHYLSAGVDITDRKQAEAELRLANERLRQSEERFSKAFRANPVTMAITRYSDGTFIAANESLLKATGYTESEFLGRTTEELKLYKNREERQEFVRQIAHRGFEHNREVCIRAKDGRLRTLLVSAERLEIDGVAHLLTVGLDITERKEAEARLRESEQTLRETQARLSTAFRASPVAMTIARLEDAKFVEVNSAFMQLLEMERDEVIGKDSGELGIWVQPEQRAQFFEKLKQERVLRNVEFDIRSRNGKVRTVLVSAEVIEINREPHLITFGLDITERKQADAELQKALEKERELSQLKSDFVSLVSHEFRTPLEIIMSSADNLQRYYERLSPEKRQQLLQTINRSVRRMSGMMEEVLVLGRLEADGMTFRPVQFDLQSVCQRICDEIESATTKRCPIELQMNAGQRDAIGDEILLRHIFTNLLSNAVKYSPAGQCVNLSVIREGSDGVFRVSDQGCGIPAADQKRLFQAFHRGSNVRQIPGTGLGLLIVQRCVELHGGKIQFESTEGKGTTFTVRLPLFAFGKSQPPERMHSGTSQ